MRTGDGTGGCGPCGGASRSSTCTRHTLEFAAGLDFASLRFHSRPSVLQCVRWEPAKFVPWMCPLVAEELVHPAVRIARWPVPAQFRECSGRGRGWSVGYSGLVGGGGPAVASRRGAERSGGRRSRRFSEAGGRGGVGGKSPGLLLQGLIKPVARLWRGACGLGCGDALLYACSGGSLNLRAHLRSCWSCPVLVPGSLAGFRVLLLLLQRSHPVPL